MKITLRNHLVDDKIQELNIERIAIEDGALLDGRPLNEEEKVKVEEIEKKINYMNNNAERTYVAPFVKGEMYKKFFEVQQLAIDKENPENIVKIVDFICSVYGNQFTTEQFLKGINMSEFASTIWNTISEINQMMMEGAKQSDTQ